MSVEFVHADSYLVYCRESSGLFDVDCRFKHIATGKWITDPYMHNALFSRLNYERKLIRDYLYTREEPLPRSMGKCRWRSIAIPKTGRIVGDRFSWCRGFVYPLCLLPRQGEPVVTLYPRKKKRSSDPVTRLYGEFSDKGLRLDPIPQLDFSELQGCFSSPVSLLSRVLLSDLLPSDTTSIPQAVEPVRYSVCVVAKRPISSINFSGSRFATVDDLTRHAMINQPVVTFSADSSHFFSFPSMELTLNEAKHLTHVVSSLSSTSLVVEVISGSHSQWVRLNLVDSHLLREFVPLETNAPMLPFPDPLGYVDFLRQSLLSKHTRLLRCVDGFLSSSHAAEYLQRVIPQLAGFFYCPSSHVSRQWRVIHKLHAGHNSWYPDD